MTYKLAPLTVNPIQKSNVVSRIFVSQPSAEEEMLIGRLFVLIELEIDKAEDQKLNDFLIAETYKHYYENEALILRDRLTNLKPDIIFEATVAKVNRSLEAFLEQEKIRLKPGSLNAIIGIIYNNKLFFAQTGAGKAILLYRPKNQRGEFLLDYSLIDITEKTSDPTQEIVQQSKFFTNVITGSVPAHGFFFFANESLFEYLTKKQITEIITTLPPAGAAEQMKNLLEQTNAFVPFFGLLVKNTTGEHDAFAAPAGSLSIPGYSPAGAGQSSVQQLNLTQEKTEQILSPSGIVNIKKWFNKLKPTSTNLKDYTSTKTRQLNLAQQKTNFIEKTINVSKKTAALTGAVATMSVKAIGQSAKLITNPETRQQLAIKTKQTAQKATQKTIGAIDNFSRLNLRYKILVIVILFSIIGLIGNIIYTGINQRNKKLQEQINFINEQFTQKENQLEATLLYNNREGAKQVLDEMAELITTLPNKTDKEKTRRAEYTARYEAKLDNLYNIIRLTENNLVIELPNEVKYILAESGNIFAAGNNKNIFTITNNDIATKNDDLLPSPLINLVFDDPLQYYIGQDKIISYRAEKDELINLAISNPLDKPEATMVYNNRLYVVQAGNIYRYTIDKKTNTLNDRQAWLKDSSSLGSVKSMAIDGRIYVIENNKIAKFSAGQKETLILDEISPQLEEPTQVYVSYDYDFLYLLEPKNKRLLVFTKNGKYISQYTSVIFDNLISATVDQPNKLIYLLNGKKLYKVEANHLLK